MRQYVTYTRVSTDEQGRSGLGLEAQQRDIDIFLHQFSEVPYEVVGAFQDMLSGATEDRPELQKALRLVRETGAELLVAKLDRLSRKVSFISGLMEDPKVRLRVAQMPHADKFQLHIYAALAEQERDFISKRTKAALQAAKARGTKLGGLRDKTMKRNEALRIKTAQDDGRVLKVIAPLQAGGKNLSQIAALLNEMTVPTARGGAWTAKQVSRIVDRANNGAAQ
ncbi:MAG: recombinase family protein [Candidatus Devosia phytovorans]|uniref:Recombinase family protein n=1 Tax=Candidatus Devosia phytovorans TaxID=3121372 RepID=A0AAJ5VR88_9HYPH|nr:recombinase family protein [Devosia sp.]WEK03283.1 MAG: recombinase family protein [Devosia sp.]